ncbi:MAG: NADH-quinone oxidoreductase subunit L [Candidatus Acidiferrales bacterium]
MSVLNYLWIIPALPLLGAAINGIFGRSWPRAATNSVALGAAGLSFAAAAELFREFLSLAPSSIPWVKTYFTWIAAGNFRADYSLQVDQLTMVMLLVVTGVGFLIHIYSTGYMAQEGGYARFFSYLNLFMFFMLTLVLAANYLVMFVGWEGVGLCSYLLIGFYFLRKSATDAGNKAFWVNRIGDFGFLLAMFLMFRAFGSLEFSAVMSSASTWPAESSGQFGTMTRIALLLFMGACGKSAQIPLYVWLPDAMEGPTPVSALIHAATMVTAGVYMVARSHIIFLHSPAAMLVVAIIGCATALFAATIGLVQNDIKKVLAYSTVSQLGYMFLACGVGAFSAGIFHLMTHAFFKGLLFLAAGSVIHAMGGQQDIRHMGGLRKKIPWTYWTMLIATLAIAGIPGFSGFFSKDEILSAAYLSPYGGTLLWAVGILTALLTSLYMFRLIFQTFHGGARYNEHETHVHESPINMLAPLAILALLSLIGGWLAAPALWGGKDHFAGFLAPVFSAASTASGSASGIVVTATGPAETAGSIELQLMAVAIAAGLIGLLVAWWMYIERTELPEKLAESMKGPYRLLEGRYFVDEFYAASIVKPLIWFSRRVLWQTVDERLIDGTVNGVADAARHTGDKTRLAESGNTRSYAAWILVGAVAFVSLLLWRAVR